MAAALRRLCKRSSLCARPTVGLSVSLQTDGRQKAQTEAPWRCVMRLQTVFLSLVFVALTQVQAAPVAKPAAASSSASSPAPASPRRDRPVGPAAAQAADNAQEPGKLRPENRVIPQIVLPLRTDPNSGSTSGRAASATSGQIDQSAARCAAQKTKTAREECRARSKSRP